MLKNLIFNKCINSTMVIGFVVVSHTPWSIFNLNAILLHSLKARLYHLRSTQA